MKLIDRLEAFLQLPVSGKGRRSHRRQMLERAHHLRDRIPIPPDLSDKDKRTSAKRIRRLMNRLAVVEHWHTSLVELGFHTLLLIPIVIMAIVALAIPCFFLWQRGIGVATRLPLLPLLALIGALAFVTLLAVPLTFYSRHQYLRVFNRLWYLWELLIIAVSGAAMFAAYRQALTLTSYRQVAAAGLAIGVLAVLAGAATGFLFYVIWTQFLDLMSRRLERLYAQELIVRYVADALTELAEPSRARRTDVFESLKGAADRFENDMPTVLHTGDFSTDYWISSRMLGVARSLRSMARGVIAPNTQTFAELQERLPRVLWATAMGHWAVLDVGVPEQAPRREALRARLVQGLRTLAVAVAPLAVIHIVRKFGIQVPEYAAAGALVWTLGAVLLLLDPDLKVISAFRQIREAVKQKTE